MIVFDMQCGEGHRFEGWFGSSADYESQKKRLLLACPVCSSEQIEKVPSPTRINVGAAAPVEMRKPQALAPKENAAAGTRDPIALAQILYSKMVDELLTKTEDLGNKFPEEARRMFYNETPARPIRGIATQEEHDALVDEGIPVARIPIPPPERIN